MRFYALKGLLIGFLVLSSVLIPLFVSAQVPFEDDFEDYTLGDLASQGGWITTGYSYWVVDNRAYSGNKSIKGKEGFPSFVRKTGENVVEGEMEIAFFIDDNEYGDWDSVLYFREGEGGDILNYIQILSSNYSVWISSTKIFENVSKDEWHLLLIGWNSNLGKMRAKLDNGEWSDWVSSDPVNFVSSLDISCDALGSKWIYFDKISVKTPICELGTCQLCEDYYTCIEAGCFWNVTLFPDPFFRGGYCVEPYEPDPEECGSFFKCQYCLTEESCLAELNCEWVDRFGTGEKCFMIEVSPEQEPWQVPELENCEELSGVEKWLCEIKNFIAGIFLPSQEKMNSLFQTFGSFNQKFPFNYLQTTKQFFSYVKEHLPTGGIPIKILGREANISFAFWEKTGEVGGLTEKIKDAVKDFTSLILIIGFFSWLLYFVRKFF